MTSNSCRLFRTERLIRPIALAFFSAAAITTHAQTATTPYVFRHLAGAPGGPGKADGVGTAARFNYATGVVADSAGNVYVTDSHGETIRKITPSGIVTTIAGTPTVAGSTDGTGAAARFNYPTGPALDRSGNLFVADWANNTIRKITPAGVVTTFAGSADAPIIPANRDGVDGIGTAARFWAPSGVAFDASGNLWVADSGDQKFRKITPDGTVSTLIPTGPTGWPTGSLWPGYVFGADTYSQPWGEQMTYTYNSEIAVDHAGNLYCGSYQQAPASYGIPSYYLVLKIDPSGLVSTLSQFPTMTSFVGLTLDQQGQLLVGTQTGLLRMNALGNVTNLTGTTGISGDGLTVTPAGDCIVADHQQILKVSPSGNVSILAGLAATPGNGDGTGAAAGFRFPGGLTVDASGTVYVTDTENSTIRKISPGGAVTTLAGKAGVPGTADGVGATARLNLPSGIVADVSGNLYVSDNLNIRKVSADGTVTTLPGIPTLTRDAPAVDETGNLYFPTVNWDSATSSWSTTINKRTPAGVITAVATLPDAGVGGLVLDHAGNIYASQNRNIFKIDPRGTVSTLAGQGADGPGASAQFTQLRGMAIDRTGNIFAVDGNSICRIAPDGTTTTIGGSSTSPGSEDGLGVDAQFNAPESVAVDNAGNIYVADTGNHSIRIGEFAGAPVIITQPQNQSAAAGSNVQFSVTASGLPTPTYQWYLNGIAFNGATASTLSFTSARSSDAGDYTVVISNALGSVTSSKATLTVSAAPATNSTVPASGNGGGSSGGGGTISGWFVFALLTLRAMRGGLTADKVFQPKRS
ncbi:MAG: immunoglobulin domain-containing protein [Lacunisphaera sp.]